MVHTYTLKRGRDKDWSVQILTYCGYWILSTVLYRLNCHYQVYKVQSVGCSALMPISSSWTQHHFGKAQGSRARDSTRAAQLPDLIPAYLSLKIRTLPRTRTYNMKPSWEIVGTNPPAIRLLNPSFIYTMASEAISTAKLRVTAAERGLASATQMIKSATEQWVCIFYNNNNNTYLYLCFNISYIACH